VPAGQDDFSGGVSFFGLHAQLSNGGHNRRTRIRLLAVDHDVNKTGVAFLDGFRRLSLVKIVEAGIQYINLSPSVPKKACG
jgi:hypothetical protein